MEIIRPVKNRILILFAVSALLVGCHQPSSSSPVETDNVMELSSLCDTLVLYGDTIYHAPMRYWDFDKVDSLFDFFDSVCVEHPCYVLEEHEQLLYDLGDCIEQLEAYRQGKRRYYPDRLVNHCIKWLELDWEVCCRNYEWQNDLCFIEWFLMCAAYYSPDLTWFVEGQTPDHCAGFCNLGNPYTATPYVPYVFLKRDKGFEVKCIGDRTEVWSIYQLADEQDRTYYLCSHNMPTHFGQWLYWRTDQGDYHRVAEYTDAPDECEGNDLFYFDPKKHIWKYSKIDENGDLKALRDEPAFRLILDGDNSRFE